MCPCAARSVTPPAPAAPNSLHYIPLQKIPILWNQRVEPGDRFSAARDVLAEGPSLAHLETPTRREQRSPASRHVESAPSSGWRGCDSLSGDPRKRAHRSPPACAFRASLASV